jgi:mRNA interferase RelE/StbE
MYKIELSNTAYKFLNKSKLPGDTMDSIKETIISLGDDPRPPGCLKMKGFDGAYYRVRKGDFRVVYEVKDKEKVVVIVHVGNRRDVYKRM